MPEHRPYLKGNIPLGSQHNIMSNKERERERPAQTLPFLKSKKSVSSPTQSHAKDKNQYRALATFVPVPP